MTQATLNKDPAATAAGQSALQLPGRHHARCPASRDDKWAAKKWMMNEARRKAAQISAAESIRGVPIQTAGDPISPLQDAAALLMVSADQQTIYHGRENLVC